MARDPVCGMQVDEKTDIILTKEGVTYFFCSQRCRQEFSVSQERVLTRLFSRRGFLKNKAFLLAAFSIVVCGSSYFFSLLIPFREIFFLYIKKIWWAIALGIFLGGFVDYYIPQEYISWFLARPEKRTIFRAVVLGFFMSVCSHGILALAMALYKKGASAASVVAFLLASPWANFPLTVMFFSFFGLKAFFLIGSAILVALNSGFIFQYLEFLKRIEQNKNTVVFEGNFSVIADIQERLKKIKFSWREAKIQLRGVVLSIRGISDMILGWILFGVILASFIGAYIPGHIFEHYFGPTLLGLLTTIVFAMIIEVCSEGSSPVAFEIFRQTGAFGNSLVFLLGGVATDYTEIGLLWKNIGKKTALWLPIITIPQIVILGYIANRFF